MDNLYSMRSVGKFSRTGQYGEMQYGANAIGVQNLFISRADYGSIIYGDNLIGDIDEFTGIYQRRHDGDEITICRQKFWVSKNPRTESQQANRHKFRDAIAAWHSLTENEKMFYNNKSKGTKRSGFNLYIKEMMAA